MASGNPTFPAVVGFCPGSSGPGPAAGHCGWAHPVQLSCVLFPRSDEQLAQHCLFNQKREGFQGAAVLQQGQCQRKELASPLPGTWCTGRVGGAASAAEEEAF